METKQVIEKYLEAWQKGDARAVRSYFADNGRFGRNHVSADDITKEIIRHPGWKNIKMLAAVYGDAGDAAIMYEGTDPRTNQTVRSSEFIKVANGKIEKMDAMIIGGASVGSSSALAFVAADAI